MTKFSFKEVAPCLFAIFIDVLGFGLVAPLLVSLFTTQEHNIFHITSSTLSYFYLGVTLALYPLLMFFGTSFIGDLSDIIGRKKTLLLSMLGMAIGFCCMSLGIRASSFSLFLFGRALSGFVAASQSVALATISDLSTKENKALHLSYVALIQCTGFVVGPLIGGVLATTAFYIPFLWAAFFASAAFLWIAFSFEETFLKKSSRKISITRFLHVFIEAYQDKRIKNLSVAFLMMQIGVGLYIPIILILLTTEFNHPLLFLGLFNGYLGVGFALGLLFVLPRMLKRFKIERIVYIALITTLLAQFFSSIARSEKFIWLLGFPWAVAVEIAFSGMFTSFSNAADKNSQGWVMGISVAIMAIAWAIAGFSAQLVPLFGTHALIFIGSVFLAASALLMKKYCSQHSI
ncbi:MAG: MFS transporter [Chlamydiota bacterium]